MLKTNNSGIIMVNLVSNLISCSTKSNMSSVISIFSIYKNKPI
jgi:hypothetical protein